jgi:plastocyanin
MTRWLRLLGIVFALGLVLSACSDDSGDGDTADAGGGDDAACDGDVCLSGTQFEPGTLTVAVGDSVTWASVDDPDHTVTADDDSFDSGTLGNGDTFEQTFDEAGEFAYHCEIHPSMTGTITVE